MNVKLLLALIVLLEPLRDVLSDHDISVSKSARKRSRGGRRSGGFGGSSKPAVLPGLGQVEAKTKDIISHTHKLLDVMTSNSKRQDFFLELCKKVADSQDVVIKSLGNILKTASKAHNNTAHILGNQKAILGNQEEIFKLISGEHSKTRKSVAQAEKSLENGMERLIHTQADIVNRLQKSEDALAAGFDKIVAAERRTQALNNQVLKAVEESAVANAQGQANITAELKETRQETVEALDKAVARQKVILDRISSAEQSELAKLEQVRGNQVDILKLIRESQRAVQKSIHEANAIERATQGLVKETQKVIQKELGEHKKDQGETQHLAKKCLENTKCDLDKVNHLLVELTKLNAASGNGIRKGLKEIRNKQSATQDRVKSAEKTVIKAIGAGFKDIDSGIGSLGERLESSRSQIQAHFNSIGKNIRDTRNSQENSQKLIDDIHGVINKLSKH